jgi:hypothetical protein
VAPLAACVWAWVAAILTVAAHAHQLAPRRLPAGDVRARARAVVQLAAG